MKRKTGIKRSKKNDFQFDWKKANILICFLIAVFGVGYLIQVNSLATKGYQIKDLEKKVAQLNQEKSDLQLEALSLQSVGSVNAKLEEMNMVALGKEDFLAAKPVAVAR
jgi:hypothetical protein